MLKLQKRPALWAGALCVALWLSGCQGNGSADAPTSPATTASTMFSGQELPGQVDRLTGTPYYTNSEKLAKLASLEGAPFLLMAPQDPTKVLLVVEAGTEPAALLNRPSQLADFSGSTKTVDSPELVKFVKEEMGVELKQNESGQVVVLVVQKTDGTSAAPLSSGSPEAQP
jgi:hypothetical protein